MDAARALLMSIRPFVVPSLLLVGLPLAILVPTTMWVFKVPRFLFESPLYHRKLEIDLGTMRAVVSDPLPDRDTPDAEYYTQGRRSIYHYDGDLGCNIQHRANPGQ